MILLPFLIIAMEIFEAIAWIAVGFVPTYVAMEAAWRVGRQRLAALEAKVRR
jgi:hypothetical protein